MPPSIIVCFTYFVTGFLTCGFGLYFLGAKKEEADKKKTPKKKTWTSIERLTFDMEMDCGFDSNVSGSEMAIAVSSLFHEKTKVMNDKQFRDIVIGSGEYSIKINVDAQFIKRD